jgi:site-specific recombinase XerD
LSAATINRHLSVISQYYRWLQGEEEGRISNPVSLIDRPKIRNKKPRAVEDPILLALDRGIRSRRDKALILVLLYLGLRIGELRRLNSDSISAIRHVRQNGTTEFFGIGEVLGNDSKKRDFIIGPAGMEALKEYLISSRSGDSLKPLFRSSRKSRLSCRSMQHILSKWCRRLGLAHSHPHQLRHAFATRNVNAGMSLPVLQELLGHESLETVQRYYKIDGTTGVFCRHGIRSTILG